MVRANSTSLSVSVASASASYLLDPWARRASVSRGGEVRSGSENTTSKTRTAAPAPPQSLREVGNPRGRPGPLPITRNGYLIDIDNPNWRGFIGAWFQLLIGVKNEEADPAKQREVGDLKHEHEKQCDETWQERRIPSPVDAHQVLHRSSHQAHHREAC